MPKYELLAEVAPAKPPQGDQPATGPTYRAAYAKDGFPHIDGILTCYDLFDHSCRTVPDRPALASRPLLPDGKHGPYEAMTYREAGEWAAAIGSAFKALGTQSGDRVGVFGGNSREWMLSLQGCNRMSLVCTPIYDTLGDNAVEYIINHSGIKVVCAAGPKLGNLAKALDKLDRPLQGVIYWGDAPADAIEAVKGTGTQILSWEEALQLGRQQPAAPEPPKPEDLATIMYTSGTTGAPKGVMHSHGGVLSCVTAARAFLKETGLEVTSNDSYFSFLTLAHIFDRVVEEVILLQGGCIGYVTDLRNIMVDVQAFKPTYFCGVPRIFERVYSGVLDKVRAAGLVSHLLFSVALRIKVALLKFGITSTPLLDRTVFAKTSQALGGRVRGIVSGAAPLARHVEDFLKATLACPVVQGYGLTETCAASFVAYPFDSRRQSGTVGPPFPCIEVRLEAVPEMGYDPNATRPKGEVCVRGPCLFKGYYKMDDMTKEAFDSDGFFHTGDIGTFTKIGALQIIDRKKNIFKLSQGEYVAVERIESVLAKAAVVEQIWVYGNSYESVLVAVVHPSKKALMEWAESNGVKGEFAAVCKDARARKHVLDELTSTGKSQRLKGFEFPKAVLLEPVPFSVDNDLMTPKFSLKRPNLQKHYKPQIDAMYTQLKNQAPAGGSSKKAA